MAPVIHRAAAASARLTAAAVSLACSPAALAQAPEREEGAVTEVLVSGTSHSTNLRHGYAHTCRGFSATEIANMAPGSLTEALTQLPQFYASATAATFNGANNGFFASPGGGSLNLRGIGSKRTLTLLDGRRVVAASIYGGPDINSFPKAMLKNIESVTGGASAAYGTDAVSGVVNYILNTDFVGFDAHAQTGQTDRGDGDSSEYSFAFGSKLGEPRPRAAVGRARSAEFDRDVRWA